jgi:hypothetical protein
VSNYPPYPCVLLSFCLPLACGIVGCALTWHVRALTWYVRIVVFLPSASLWDSWARPHLACARPHLACARPHLACSPVRALTWNVRDLTCARPHLACACPHLVCGRTLNWHVRALTWHVCALCVRPSPKSNVGVQLPPYPCALLSFCLPLACGIVGCALTWHVRALACARPLRPPLSKKQCRCPTTPLIRACCCVFAFGYLVG